MYTRIALIILLDQFSRNIYRGTAAAFENDAKALAIESPDSRWAGIGFRLAKD